MAAEFHILEVAAVEPLTDDSVVIRFEVPNDLRDAYRFTAGEHLILRAEIDGEDVRRSYSICASAGSESLQVAVKRLGGGVFSTYANYDLAAGDRLEVATPTGDFTITTRSSNRRHLAAVAAGSGITPVMAMIETVLEEEPKSSFSLIFGNRTTLSVMFLEELGALKDRFPDRLVVMHVLSQEGNTVPLFTGRIDAEKLDKIFSTVLDTSTIEAWYLCGPVGLVETTREVLTARGVPDDAIQDELFYAGDDVTGAVVAETDAAGAAEVFFTLNGRTSRVLVQPDGPPILDHALAVRPDAPFSCRSGACASCRALVIKGEVILDRNWALNAEEVAAGQILSCQAHPASDVVELDYDI
jgi:ring-1,2-phenylacetyl-CoA epoxidase subunit PaaE